LRVITNILAAVGLLAMAAVGFIYHQGWVAVQRFDPKATQVMGEFVREVLDSDVASATVLKMPLADGVSIEQAIEAMTSRANALDIRLVSRLPFSEEMRRVTGQPYPYLEIFMFRDPLTAARLLDFNPDFMAYLPCRIALYEDPDGQAWLSTMDLDLLIYVGREMDPALKVKVLAIKEGLMEIMVAGANGTG
jgi:uncharacterized protein (DUF302 family)